MPQPAVTRRRPRAVAALVAASLLGWQLPAVAEQALSVELEGAALAPREHPALHVDVRQPLAALVLELERSDGEKVRRTLTTPKAGRRHTFRLEQPEGAFRYEGQLIARFAKGEPQSMPLAFEAVRLRPPALDIAQDAVVLDARRVRVKVDRTPVTVDLRVSSDEGDVLDERQQRFEQTGEGGLIELGWDQPEGKRVMRLDLRATDRYGFFQDAQLYPWAIEIPHEDVLFDTGSAEIAASERPKLDEALAELAKAIERYGRWAKVELFVAGYTDTVGDAARNQALSEARALSIARYFRQRGVRLGISYAGFGESALLVPTPDETPEPRNRRAAYIVSVEAPADVRWVKLK